MRNRLLLSLSLLMLPLAGITSGAPGPGAEQAEASEVRQVERQRVRSLVQADLPVARQLHADDFQLITPGGVAISRDEYLGDIETGQLDYRAWEPGAIVVRLYGEVAVIRYQDVRFEVYVGGQLVHRGASYHTNVYERRNGQWQVVWSQASGGEFVDP